MDGERGGARRLITTTCFGLIRYAYHYAEDAPLFIITLKESGQKLQLWKGGNIQFMDAYNSCVTKEYIKQNWNQLKNVLQFPNGWDRIPEEYKKYNFCRLLVEQNGRALYFVSDKHITLELCFSLVKKDWKLLKYIPEKYKTSKLCKMAFKRNKASLKYVPKKYKTCEPYKDIKPYKMKKRHFLMDFIYKQAK